MDTGLGMHGGDVYKNRIKYDFSVNINPQGVPESVRKAYLKSVDIIEQYPEINSDELKTALGGFFALDNKNIAVGNGASELIMAAFQALRPERLIITAPDFYGYLRAARAVGCEEIQINIINEDGSLRDWGEILRELAEQAAKKSLVMLTNPNNPTGLLYDREFLSDLFQACLDKGAILGVDESFLPFTDMGIRGSLKDRVDEGSLLIFTSFTKLFAMPSIRLGALLSSGELIEKAESHLPEWNISGAANAAGLAALKESAYIASTPGMIKKERDFLSGELERLGIRVYPSAANYILIYSDLPLYEELLKRGILIRDCSDYRGLKRGYYRLAVRTRKENEIIIEAIKEIGKKA